MRRVSGHYALGIARLALVGHGRHPPGAVDPPGAVMLDPGKMKPVSIRARTLLRTCVSMPDPAERKRDGGMR